MRFHIVYLEYFLGLFEDDEGLVFQDGSAQDDNLFLGAVGVFRVPQRGGDAVPWAEVYQRPEISKIFPVFQKTCSAKLKMLKVRNL